MADYIVCHHLELHVFTTLMNLAEKTFTSVTIIDSLVM